MKICLGCLATPCPTQEPLDGHRRLRCRECARKRQIERVYEARRNDTLLASKSLKAQKTINYSRLDELENQFPGRAALIRLAKEAGLLKIQVSR